MTDCVGLSNTSRWYTKWHNMIQCCFALSFGGTRQWAGPTMDAIWNVVDVGDDAERDCDKRRMRAHAHCRFRATRFRRKCDRRNATPTTAMQRSLIYVPQPSSYWPSFNDRGAMHTMGVLAPENSCQMKGHIFGFSTASVTWRTSRVSHSNSHWSWCIYSYSVSQAWTFGLKPCQNWSIPP